MRFDKHPLDCTHFGAGNWVKYGWSHLNHCSLCVFWDSMEAGWKHLLRMFKRSCAVRILLIFQANAWFAFIYFQCAKGIIQNRRNYGSYVMSWYLSFGRWSNVIPYYCGEAAVIALGGSGGVGPADDADDGGGGGGDERDCVVWTGSSICCCSLARL